MIRISLSDQVLDNQPRQYVRTRKPRWLRMQLGQGEQYSALRSLVETNRLHTVCQEARCPNMGECWSRGVATLMIMGDTCTRSCGFCHIKTGRPTTLDLDEPRRVGDAVRIMNLNYVVITSVNRDELPDGGAGVWAETIRQVRLQAPATKIEVLIPDFEGNWDALGQVFDARPDVINHNLETVPRLYRVVRPQAKYPRSIELLRRCKEAGYITKTGIMVGIGERDEEVVELMKDVLAGTQTSQGPCDILTIGQYLQPTPGHLPVSRFVTPEQFAEFKRIGEELGFDHLESSPMTRSSYHADQQFEDQNASKPSAP